MDQNGVIWDSWYDGSGHWSLQFINSKFVGEPGIGPPALIYDWLMVSLWNDPSNTQQHFTYLGKDEAIHDTFYDSDPPLSQPHWVHQTFDSGGGKASSSPFGCIFHQQQHIGFLANFGDFLDRWYDGSGHWALQAIAGSVEPRRTNGPQALLGVPPCIWVDYTNSQQHFTYVGADRAIYDAFWDSDRQAWKLQKLTVGGATAGPEAWSRPTVCNFRPAGFINRVYIAYRDAVGMVWIVTYANDQWFLVKLKDLPLGAATDFQGNVPSASGNVPGTWWMLPACRCISPFDTSNVRSSYRRYRRYSLRMTWLPRACAPGRQRRRDGGQSRTPRWNDLGFLLRPAAQSELEQAAACRRAFRRSGLRDSSRPHIRASQRAGQRPG